MFYNARKAFFTDYADVLRWQGDLKEGFDGS